MFNYCAIRRVKKIIGTTSGGNPLWGGPFEFARDLPIAAAAVILAVLFAAGGFVAARLVGAVVGVLGGAIVLGAALYLIGRLRRSPEGFSIGRWVAARVDLHFARPTVIDGPNPFHPDTPPASAPKTLGTVDVIEDNIRVTASGQYWAEYRVGNPLEMGLIGPAQHKTVLTEHQALLDKALRRGAYIAQFKEPISVNELTERAFTDNDDPDELEFYSKLVCDQIDEIRAETRGKGSGHWPHRINYVLAIYVGNDASTAAGRRDEIIADLPFTWELVPATRQEMYWTWFAQCTSGAKMTGTNHAYIPEQLPRIVLEDGAHSDTMFSKRPRWFYRKRGLLPVLKVTVEGEAPSYQAVLTAKLPDVLDFPDETDFLSVLRHMGEPINWAIRCTPKTRETAMQENRKTEGTIQDNTEELAPFDQRADPYARENELLAVYDEKLANPTAAAVTNTLFIAIGARSAKEVKRIANAVRDVLSPMGILFDQPEPGKQEELWSAMHPGAPRSPAMDQHAVETTIGEFAELVPFTTASIGHADGPVIGRNLTSGLGDLVRFAAEKLILAGRAAAIAIAASVGGGKSTLGKLLAIFAHVRGDPWGAFDRSDIVDAEHPDGVGEWAVLAEVLDDVQVIDITKPPGSLDPLKVWADEPETASRHTYNMLIEVLEDLDKVQKLALAEALDPTELRNRAIDSQMALSRYLMSQRDPAAQMVGREIRVWKHRPFAAAIFDEKLPALTLTARGTVFRTHGLTLPSEEKVLNKHLNDKLRPEERYAPVIYSLGSVFLKSAFRKSKLRKRGPAYIFVDEAWTVTCNPIGMEILEVEIRDGRKHFIVVVFMSHHAQRDFAHDAFRLITTKFVGRAEDGVLARANLEWFGAMPITDERVADLMAAKDGRFYMCMVNDDAGRDGASLLRDEKHRRQVAEIQILRPNDPRLLKALNTTPAMMQNGVDPKTRAA